MQLRDYQRRAIDGLFRYFETHAGNPLIVAPTGSGKSVIIGALCKEILSTWPDQRIMVVTHVKELLEQNHGKIKGFWPDAPAGLYSASLRAKESRASIVVAGIQSVFRKPHAFGWRDLILIDECHLLAPESDTMYRKFIDGLKRTNPALKVIGLTATDYRLKTGRLTEGPKRLFTDVAVSISLQELLDAGHIAPLVSKSSVIQGDLSGVGLLGGEFNAKQAESAMDKEALTAAALDEVFRLAGERRSWLFFCTGIDHAEHVAQAIRERGVTAACVTGTTPKEERERILAGLKSGEIQAVTNANVLTTGFDAPNIDLLVLLRPTTSPGLYTQILGRGMRTCEGKANCLVLDYAGNIERHGPITHIKPPRPAGTRATKGERHNPTCLICPQCRMASPPETAECAECGYTFERPERVRHETRASTAEVMVRAARDPREVGEWVDVDAVHYARHKKPGKPDSLRVEYQCGMTVFKEWICLCHEGYAREKALRWFNSRVPMQISIPPGVVQRIPDELVDIALDQKHHIRQPSRIRVRKSGDYTEIIAHDFNRPEETRADDRGAA